MDIYPLGTFPSFWKGLSKVAIKDHAPRADYDEVFNFVRSCLEDCGTNHEVNTTAEARMGQLVRTSSHV